MRFVVGSWSVRARLWSSRGPAPQPVPYAFLAVRIHDDFAFVRQAIERTGAELRFLPAYSPDFNPIEKAFAKLKAKLRKAAARTVETLWNTIAELIDTFTPNECANYFASAGYDPD